MRCCRPASGLNSHHHAPLLPHPCSIHVHSHLHPLPSPGRGVIESLRSDGQHSSIQPGASPCVVLLNQKNLICTTIRIQNSYLYCSRAAIGLACAHVSAAPASHVAPHTARTEQLPPPLPGRSTQGPIPFVSISFGFGALFVNIRNFWHRARQQTQFICHPRSFHL